VTVNQSTLGAREVSGHVSCLNAAYIHVLKAEISRGLLEMKVLYRCSGVDEH
jgi:hypothetical protein